jgi:hypothetical protein
VATAASRRSWRGVFLLPTPAAGEKYAVVEASKLGTLFRI